MKTIVEILKPIIIGTSFVIGVYIYSVNGDKYEYVRSSNDGHIIVLNKKNGEIYKSNGVTLSFKPQDKSHYREREFQNKNHTYPTLH
jgi:hypothetical protein